MQWAARRPDRTEAGSPCVGASVRRAQREGVGGFGVCLSARVARLFGRAGEVARYGLLERLDNRGYGT